MVGLAAEQGEQQQEGDEHKQATPTAPDHPAEAVTKAKAKSMFG
jgi:hypothetical protein